MEHMEEIKFKIEQYEGPLDVLLSLVEKHKMDIADVPIDLLCDQYLAWIKDAQEHDVELACEFLYMASELMLIKSRMLLPRDPQKDEDPRQQLMDALAEYQRAKLAAAELSDMFALYGGRMAKEQDDISPDRSYVADHDADLLRAALHRVLTETRLTEETAKTAFEDIVHAPRIPVETIMHDLIRSLKSRRKKKIWLDGYFRDSADRSECVAKFIGILELLKFHIVALDEGDESDEGVTPIDGHIGLRLCATDEEIAAASLESDIY